MEEKQIYLIIIGALAGVVNILFWARIKRIEKDIEETRQKSTTIEKNYLSRFEKLHRRLGEVEKNIIRKIYEVKLSVFGRTSGVKDE
ncbi:MAG: hypothetical protein KJ571_08650 [Bacteroidetes bacterium]|nr:hypothetical protein [Bacteroidota bacterium]